MKGNLIIISSPSGGGKGTLIREILKEMPNIGYSVSMTTRQMREGEIDGKDYYFVTKDEFLDAIGREEFLEFAEVHGNFYGTSIKQVENQILSGNDVILEIDVQGAAIIRKKLPSSVAIFILPPSFQVLKERLTARATETEETLSLRLHNSYAEVNQFEHFDYVVVNNEIAPAINDLKTIIFAERLKRDRQTDAIQGILDSFDASKF
ncbi:MAG TPA: guanylate kinase [Pyrinomonadaceae bacterium]|nr:guanylate kinase [Pyrinomonadaceae bacterium]